MRQDDETAQGPRLEPPRTHPGGAVPARRGRLSIAGMLCYRAGHRPHLLSRPHRYHRRRGEEASFTWRDYRDFLVLAHHARGTPVVLVWDNLNRHACAEMAAFIDANTSWPRVFQLPSYAPELNPAEGIWSLLVRGGLANLAVGSIDTLAAVAKHELKKLQYRPDVLAGCLAETGLRISPSNVTN